MSESISVESINLARWAVKSLIASRGYTLKGSFLAGSLTNGLGNRLSDIDVFVILDDAESALEKAEHLPDERQFLINGNRIDIEVVSVREIKETFDLFLNARYSSESLGDLRKIHYRSIDFVSRYLDSINLSEGPEIVEPFLKNQLRASFQAYVVAFHCLSSAGLQEDFRGFAEEKSWDDAAIAASRAITAAVKGYVASHGLTYLSPKYVLRQLRKLSHPGLPYQDIVKVSCATELESSGQERILALQQKLLLATAYRQQNLKFNPKPPNTEFWSAIPLDWGGHSRPELVLVPLQDGVLLNSERKDRYLLSNDALSVIYWKINGNDEHSQEKQRIFSPFGGFNSAKEQLMDAESRFS